MSAMAAGQQVVPGWETLTWSGTLTAVSSIAHGGENRGTITLLRREVMVTSEGLLLHVPVISGNTLRGRLRRIGEELLRDALDYEGLLPAAVAHVLRGGGALAKTGREPVSGAQLGRLRMLVPQVAVFGGAGGGTIINGALDVGKVVPQVAETQPITGVASGMSSFTLTQLESYTRQDDGQAHDFPAVAGGGQEVSQARLAFDEQGRPKPVVSGSAQMLFHIETFPAGTVFSTWLRLRRPTLIEVSFLSEVLEVFSRQGRLGGRVAVGHGQVRADLVPDRPVDAGALPDWSAMVRAHRGEILELLACLG